MLKELIFKILFSAFIIGIAAGFCFGVKYQQAQGKKFLNEYTKGLEMRYQYESALNK